MQVQGPKDGHFVLASLVAFGSLVRAHLCEASTRFRSCPEKVLDAVARRSFRVLSVSRFSRVQSSVIRHGGGGGVLKTVPADSGLDHSASLTRRSYLAQIIEDHALLYCSFIFQISTLAKIDLSGVCALFLRPADQVLVQNVTICDYTSRQHVLPPRIGLLSILVHLSLRGRRRNARMRESAVVLLAVCICL